MGLPRIQVLPSDIQYYSEQVTSPVTFFSTFETFVNAETDQDGYDIIPLEELEVGMVTEVSTSAEDSDTMAEVGGSEHQAIIPVAVECEFTGSENETETCDLENQTYSEDDGSYTAEILSEVVSNTFHAGVEQNHQNPGSISENCNEGLDVNSENLNELVADICNDDLVFAWLSSLDGNSTISTTDFESLVLPAVDNGASDAGLAKDELRSFLLSRKTKTNVIQEPENSKTLRSHRSRHDDITGTWRRTKLADSDSNPEELSRHRRRQERNRIAARKCRQKRTKLAEELTDESEQLRKHNEELTSEVRDLTRELRKLENFVLDHDLHMGSFQCNEHMSALLLSQHLPELL